MVGAANGDRRVAFTAAADHKTLRVLDLFGNSIGDRGARALSALVCSNHALRCVDVRRNLLTAHGARALLRALRVTSHVRQLDVWPQRVLLSTMPQLSSDVALRAAADGIESTLERWQALTALTPTRALSLAHAAVHGFLTDDEASELARDACIPGAVVLYVNADAPLCVRVALTLSDARAVRLMSACRAGNGYALRSLPLRRASLQLTAAWHLLATRCRAIARRVARNTSTAACRLPLASCVDDDHVRLLTFADDDEDDDEDDKVNDGTAASTSWRRMPAGVRVWLESGALLRELWRLRSMRDIVPAPDRRDRNALGATNNCDDGDDDDDEDEDDIDDERSNFESMAALVAGASSRARAPLGVLVPPRASCASRTPPLRSSARFGDQFRTASFTASDGADVSLASTATSTTSSAAHVSGGGAGTLFSGAHVLRRAMPAKAMFKLNV
jgi:hypothetical protein